MLIWHKITHLSFPHSIRGMQIIGNWNCGNWIGGLCERFSPDLSWDWISHDF